jgi:hypothetical protein
MTRTIRLFLLVEAAAFLAASLVHTGYIVTGYEHPKARIAEGIIGIVLLVGLAYTWARPESTRGAGLGTQGFALLGTLVGAFTIAIGIGPRTVPDIVFHVGLVILLVWGLAVTARAPSGAHRRGA